MTAWHQTRDGNWAGPGGARVVKVRRYVRARYVDRYRPEAGGLRGDLYVLLPLAQQKAERMAQRASR